MIESRRWATADEKSMHRKIIYYGMAQRIIDVGNDIMLTVAAPNFVQSKNAIKYPFH